MRQRFVMGNWKMNGSRATIDSLLLALRDHFPENAGCTCVVFPPAPYLPQVSDCLNGSPIQWGAQNMYPRDAGAYTGEIAASMLVDFGCRYVLVGHSERRQLFHEDVKFVAEKFHHAKDHGMIPVLCVGETLLEREEERTKEVLVQQLRAVMHGGLLDFQHCVLAYEPVWAIGTGKTATPEEAQAVHAFIREEVASYTSREVAQDVPIIYGGSVNESNAKALFSMPDIDGGLVGGASLYAQQFLDIVTCIKCY